MVELTGSLEPLPPSRLWSWRGTSSTNTSASGGGGGGSGSVKVAVQGPSQLVYYKPQGRSFTILQCGDNGGWKGVVVEVPSDVDVTVDKMAIGRGVGGVVVWSGGGWSSSSSSSCYRVDGIDLNEKGELVITNTSVTLQPITTTAISSINASTPAVSSSGSYAAEGQSGVGSKLLLSHPQAHFQVVEKGDGSSSGTATVKTSLTEGEGPHPPLSSSSRALRRCRHLLSILQAPPSTTPHPTSAGGVRVVDTQDLYQKTLGLTTTTGDGTGGVGVIAAEELGGSSGVVVLLTTEGDVRLVEVDDDNISSNLVQWKMMYGMEPNGSSRRDGSSGIKLMEEGEESVPKTRTSGPKHGKEDEKNEQHVGGNMWAGGSGGSDTAGLGGRGGPYRLDKGHTVHQVRRRDDSGGGGDY